MATSPVELLRIAQAEKKRSDVEENPTLRREAAEKAWLAVVEATDAFLAKKKVYIIKGPEAHKDRRDKLKMLGYRDLAGQYSIFETDLHGDCFYSICDPQELAIQLEKVQRFVRKTRETSTLRRRLLARKRN